MNPLTSFFRNNGDGTFDVTPLPDWTQVSPVNGILVLDANSDGNLDVLMSGNDYGNEVFAGRYDAGTGVVLLGDGDGNFRYQASTLSGLTVLSDILSSTDEFQSFN